MTQSMYNGLFLDISEYYDADTELNKDAFAPAVMEAGVLDGARYVLPLRYDIPLLYVFTDQLEAAGLGLDSLETGFSGLEEVLQSLGGGAVSFQDALGYYLPNVFSEVFDYDADNVTVTEEEMEAFIRSCKNIMALRTAPYDLMDYGYYIQNNEYWGTPGYVLPGTAKADIRRYGSKKAPPSLQVI